MNQYPYYCLHIPSGSRFLQWSQFESEYKFLEAIDRWNGSGQGLWQYWRA